MGIGPVFAVPTLLERHGLKLDDIDLIELNEAFAVQTVYCRDRLGLDPEKLNVNGGAISIGHPYGMTGARQVGGDPAGAAPAQEEMGRSSRCASAAEWAPRGCSKPSNSYWAGVAGIATNTSASSPVPPTTPSSPVVPIVTASPSRRYSYRRPQGSKKRGSGRSAVRRQISTSG